MTCHAPIAERIRQRRGFHGQMDFSEQRCIDCHSEHKGRNFDIRAINFKQFDHAATGWPLKGKHLEAKCADCHRTGRSFLGASAECATCHADPHKGQFAGKSCDSCHGTESTSFKLPGFDHSKTRFPLIGEHTKVRCESCHVDGKFKPLPFEDCSSCHKDPHRGQFVDRTCASCHSPDKDWKGAQSGVDHSKTRFPLVGAHTKVSCESCHKQGRFHFESLECQSCHADKHGGQFGSQGCKDCHSQAAFKPSTFDHARARFPLTGKHAGLACRQCHQRGRYKPTRFEDCSTCHRDPHRGQFSDRKCESCHSTQSWKKAGAQVDHAKTRFPLVGAHAKVACESCHKQGRFKFESLECSSCHQDPHRGQFGARSCESCHGIDSFKTVRFDHSKSAFPLEGKHAQVACASCHQNGKFKGIDHERCSSCHQDFHKGQFAGKDCATCHSPDGWMPVTFDHTKDSGFPLLGQHRLVACQDCHKGGKFKPLAKDCASCHQNVHNDPRKAECKDCHTPLDWTPREFPHDLPTFRLEGQHSVVPCVDCHEGGVEPPLEALSPDCASCHRDPHAGQLGTLCDTCHRPVSWAVVRFQHVDLANRLFGVHSTLACRDCHQRNVFKAQSSECLACHQSQFEQTTIPNHQVLGFVRCTDCHTQVAWRPATFDHDRFPLRGGHAGLECQDCHAGGRFEGTSPACQSCHRDDYDRTSNPNHRSAGLPLTCQSCHTTTAWRPAALDHSRFFPLNGAHAAVQCDGCHRGGVFAGTPSQCVGCHQADFNATSSPNHAQSGFPTSCESCHSTNAWRPSTFDHDRFFPIPHRGVNVCQDCHRGGNAQVFSCTDCHAHDREEMDDKHDDVRGYQYASQACLSCHPRGEED